ncbi:MAG: plasmid mobilization relaxosome protein MobC [Clostridia bacterium]|nr:plasmid mobilization relaxosome protein MobC [Clostridia bacterium]
MKKDKIITIRVNENEKKKLIEKSKIAKLSLSKYLIKQGLDKEIVIVDGLNEVVAELRRIGNNINQLTYLANSGRIYTVDLGKVKQEIGKAWNVINELQKKW